MPDRLADDPHVSDLVLSPERTLALLRPHLPCPCADCAAVTLMIAAALAIGQHYPPEEVSRAWQQVTLAGEKVAELTAALRLQPRHTLTTREDDTLARKRPDVSRCQAFRLRGAH